MTTLRNSNNGLRIRTLIAVAVPIALASWIIPSAVCAPGSVQNPASGGRLVLRECWQVQTSTGQADGAVISKAGFAATGWYPTYHPAVIAIGYDNEIGNSARAQDSRWSVHQGCGWADPLRKHN